jgi:alpha/beta superfamily hydrolase
MSSLIIPGHGVKLEAVLRRPERKPLRGAAVLCHPHPVYGGTMNNRVVFRAGKAAIDSGLAALRFNFRGVGASTGEFEDGVGEQQDVAAAVDWLRTKLPDLPLVLIGFSFGAWVGLQVAGRDPRIVATVGLGLPVNHYDFDFLTENVKPALYIIGTADEFCPRDRMERLARRLPPHSDVRWIEGADHFFGSHIDQVQLVISDFLRELPLDKIVP